MANETGQTKRKADDVIERLARIEAKLEVLERHEAAFMRMDERLDNIEIAFAKRNAYMAGAIATVSVLWGFVVTFFYLIKRAFNSV